jgi:hypothetical protein
VRTVARLLDRPVLDRSASTDIPLPHVFGIPRRNFTLLWRLVRRIAVRQPTALWAFCKVFCECARKNPRAIDYVGILAAFYLHLRPFSRLVVSLVDRQIAEIDAGKWRPPQAPLAEPAALRKPQAA